MNAYPDLATMTSRDHTNDVTLVIAICDLINSSELGAKEARKVIQRKLCTGDSVVQLLALKLLQQLADNGGPRFHAQLCAKSFIDTLHALALSPPESQVKHRTLTFLSSCEARFSDDTSLAAIVTLNRTLRDPNFTSSTSGSNSWSRIVGGITSGSSSSGRDEEDAGRGTVKRVPRRRKTTNSSSGTIETRERLEEESRGGRREERRREESRGERREESRGRRRDESRNKKQISAEELEKAKNKAQILTQTLSFTDPEKEDITKNELIQEFYQTCKEQHGLIAKHLTEAAESGETEHLENLLVANDELQSAFQMYDQMLERANVQRATSESRTDAPGPRPVRRVAPAQVQSLSASRDGNLNGSSPWGALEVVIPQRVEEIPTDWARKSPVFATQESRPYVGEYANTMAVPTSTNPFYQRRLSPPESPSFPHKNLPNNGYSPPDSRPSSRPSSRAGSRSASPFSSAPYGIISPARTASPSTNPFHQHSPSLLAADLDLIPPPTIPIAPYSTSPSGLASVFTLHSDIPPVSLNPNNPFASRRSSLQTNPFLGAGY